MPHIFAPGFSPFGPSQHPTSFLATMDTHVRAILSRAGLDPITDTAPAELMSMGGIFGGLDFGDMELPSGKDWDDSPPIDKIFAGLRAAAKRRREAPPEPETIRLAGTIPGKCHVCVMVAMSFLGVSSKDDMNLAKLGTWSMAVRDTGGETRIFQGDTLAQPELDEAFAALAKVCEHQAEINKLQPTTELGPYVHAEGLPEGLLPANMGIGVGRVHKQFSIAEQLQGLGIQIPGVTAPPNAAPTRFGIPLAQVKADLEKIITQVQSQLGSLAAVNEVDLEGVEKTFKDVDAGLAKIQNVIEEIQPEGKG